MEILERGVCRLSLTPIRKNPGDTSEIISQLLFGEHYSVLQIADNKSWLQIKTHFDNYSGWIDFDQHTGISEDYFEQICHSDYKICLDISASILYKKIPINILMGSILPITPNELFKMEEQLAFNGEAKSLSQKRDFEFLNGIALKYLNAPYLWGGRTPFGIDCSGLVQQVYRICGYQLARDSEQQAIAGSEVKTLTETKAGDLAFFSKNAGKISHVGIILENSRLIHSHGKVRIDMISEDGIFDEVTNKVTHKLVCIRRIFRNESTSIST